MSRWPLGPRGERRSVEQRSVALLLAALAASIGFGLTPAPASANDSRPAASPVLVLITTAGLVPPLTRVPAGTPIVWLNRTAAASLAISFDRAFPDEGSECPERRAFNAVPGFGPFTTLLPPGAVVSLCAPGPGPATFRYSIHGDLAFEGAVEVIAP